MQTGLRSPGLLHIGSAWGAMQAWYPSWFKRMSGCGPTAASNLVWYLAASRPQCAALVEGEDMLRLMERMWRYVTPGMRGVDRAEILADGLTRFGQDQGVPLAPRSLEIPERKALRPAPEDVLGFLTEAFRADAPVAFLNLHNGGLPGLDSWHWVTLVSVDDSLLCEMFDQGRRQVIDLGQWLRTTAKGGALVTLRV